MLTKLNVLAKELPSPDHEDCCYHDDWIQLWCGDAANLIFLPDEYIDLIVTSPPYNIGPKSSNGRVLWHGITYSTHNDKEPEGKYQAKQIAVLNELWRITRPGGSLFYNHKIRNRNGVGIHPLSWISQTNWIFRQQIIWDRGSTHNHEMTYFWPIDELVFWLTKGTDGIYLSAEGAKMGTVWRFNFQTNTDHPAPFPPELAARCIRAASQPGDIILDPFGGSMTTCFVAKQLKRLSIGVDISKDYVVKYAHRCRQEVLL
jgi:modification methylase